MSAIRIGNGYWVVVCDGRKALIFENAGDADLLNFITKESRIAENPPTHVQGAERPGRVHQSVGAERSSVEQTDWHDQAERAFLRDLATRLDRAVAAGETVVIDFPVTRQDIAEMAGTTLHTASRVMSAWEERGIVRSGRRKVTVLAAQRLLAIAEGRGDASA